jgi:hypothetical protein
VPQPTAIHYALTATLNKSQYVTGETFQLCYQLNPNVPFELVMYESINNGPMNYQLTIGPAGSACTTSFAWDQVAGSRVLLLEAWVDGVLVAQTNVYATVSAPALQWTHLLTASIQHNQSHVDINGLQPGVEYRICLNGTIRVYTDAAQHNVADIDALGAFMTVGGYSPTDPGPGYCLEFQAGSASVRVTCDGSRFANGNPYWGTVSGAFSIDVYALQ